MQTNGTKPRRVAIACQGGGIHGAFTCGVLTKILRAKEDEENGKLPAGTQRRFDICGLRSDKLYPASKFDRDPAFVNGLRDHGEKRGEDFLKLWFTTSDLSTLQWPQNALEAHTEQLAEPATA